MADRVKYFLLGVLFLVVAGVIAYDRWNSAGEPKESNVAEGPSADTGRDFEMTQVPRPIAVDTTPPQPADQGNPFDPTPIPGPAQQPIRTEPPAPKQEPKVVELKPEPPAPDKTHVVKKGDTLEAIAIKYYGNRDGIEWIADANNLGNRNRIFEKQKLIIPAKKEIVKEGGSGGTKAAAKPSTGKVPSRYTVKAGDGDVYAICRRLYGSNGLSARVHEVMKLNHLYNRDVKTGTVLMLPAR